MRSAIKIGQNNIDEMQFVNNVFYLLRGKPISIKVNLCLNIEVKPISIKVNLCLNIWGRILKQGLMLSSD